MKTNKLPPHLTMCMDFPNMMLGRNVRYKRLRNKRLRLYKCLKEKNQSIVLEVKITSGRRGYSVWKGFVDDGTVPFLALSGTYSAVFTL